MELLEVLCAAFGWGWLTVLLLRTVLLLVGRGELRFEEKPQRDHLLGTGLDWIGVAREISLMRWKRGNAGSIERKGARTRLKEFHSIHERLFTDY